MSTRAKSLTAGAAAILLAITLVAYNAWRNMTDAATQSCVVSLTQGLANHAASHEQSFTSAGEEWKVLAEEVGERLISEAAKTHSFDCSRVSEKGIGWDHWGNRLTVAVRRAPGNGKVEFKVWSKGRDGVADTPDDVRLPGSYKK